ncbi:hypothetical protein ASE14_14985 [Agromyces sp. Root81]|uniref:DUF5054 domain-containing protein n=1 Tax=Agromyces sp. Root81 TaxID=1736601 RepID=UPI0006FDA657|nr:DUF5054 domain-containing protein [Agromyces sp. Root81]KRC59089.1 hypothetical protein ASE14_14985 [Agromyces sp. Root81]
MASPRTIHVLQKTHLDVGYTDYAQNVIARYVDEYIPAAIALADRLAERGGPEQFIWTTGSWLVSHALRNGTEQQRGNVDRAIREGKIAWHAMPMTIQSELADRSLFEFGLGISQDLDRTYGRSTVAAKMTDVPGHTVGVVPLLRAGGVELLHLGVNPVSALPEVPHAFRWRAPDGSEIVVVYDSDYGASRVDPEQLTMVGDQALYIAFTNDNHGPPTESTVMGLFDELRTSYPDAEIVSSTLDRFAAAITEFRDELPCIESEIGDTWIHGVASDPWVLSRYRRLSRAREAWSRGHSPLTEDQLADVSEGLLLVAEHTWGESGQVFLPDFVNYEKSAFEAARRRDEIDISANPERYAPQLEAALSIRPRQGWSYSAYEQSWQGKRDFLEHAIDRLPESVRSVVRGMIASPAKSDAPVDRVPVLGVTKLGAFEVAIAGDGALSLLRDRTGRDWAAQHPIGQYRYESFAPEDYGVWFDNYCRGLDLHAGWAIADFGKPGFESSTPAPRREVFRPVVLEAETWREGTTDVLRVTAAMSPDASERLGAPRVVEIDYRASDDGAALSIELRVCQKDANRLPEASWFSLAPRVAEPEGWRLRKLGALVDPVDVVRNGNRRMHAVEALEHAVDDVTITSIDAAVVAIGEQNLLHYGNSYGDLREGFHFLLHNNVWGTNYRMWFEEDQTYEFRLEFGDAAAG